MKKLLFKLYRILAFLMYCGLSLLTASCSDNLKLISLGEFKNRWDNVVVPEEPIGTEEKAVVKAASSKKAIRVGEITAICLATNETSQIVSSVVGRDEIDETIPKKITHYLVVNGKIRAYSKTVMEPCPDVDYEKTIFETALRAASPEGFSVTVFTRPRQNLTVKGVRKNPCLSKVTVINGFSNRADREIISEREINICLDNL